MSVMMAQHFLVSVDLANLQSSKDNGLDLKTISFLKNIHFLIKPETWRIALEFLHGSFGEFSICCDCSLLGDLKNIITLLDEGATKVFVSPWQMETIIDTHLLPSRDFDRLILSFDQSFYGGNPQDQVEGFLSKYKSLRSDSAFAFQVQDPQLLTEMHQHSSKEICQKQYVMLDGDVRADYINAINNGCIPIVPAHKLTADAEKFPHLLPVHLLITTAIHSDRPDGLFPTVVTDERGICLGLVYSDSQSIEAALKTGYGAYHSRSRKGLWIKGKESGNTQTLISIAWDCDSDALQFRVKQRGDGRPHLVQTPVAN